jgi:predicted DNA-binding transcriptional regulator AlpA
MQGELKSAAAPIRDAAEQYVSVRETCELLGLSRSAVFALVGRHDLRRYRRAGDSRTYLRLADIEAARPQMPSQQRELIRPAVDPDQPRAPEPATQPQRFEAPPCNVVIA